MNEITQSDFNRVLFLAVSRTYLKAIVEATPGKGNVAGEWDIRIDGNDVIIYNEEFGDVVLYLERGTDTHIIRAKNKKFLKFPKPDGPPKKGGKKIPGNQAFEKDGYIFAKAVYHPGIEARLFIHKVLEDESIKHRFEIEFEKLLIDKIGLKK
jgi:hypothetical protein